MGGGGSADEYEVDCRHRADGCAGLDGQKEQRRVGFRGGREEAKVLCAHAVRATACPQSVVEESLGVYGFQVRVPSCAWD